LGVPGISCLNRLSITTLSVATPHHEPHSYTFDHIADELTAQEDMFCLVGAPVIENVMAGFNSSIFAYGQTGSGKTHTILGQPCDPDQVTFHTSQKSIPSLDGMSKYFLFSALFVYCRGVAVSMPGALMRRYIDYGCPAEGLGTSHVGAPLSTHI
jgi:hypothetical protein